MGTLPQRLGKGAPSLSVWGASSLYLTRVVAAADERVADVVDRAAADGSVVLDVAVGPRATHTHCARVLAAQVDTRLVARALHVVCGRPGPVTGQLTTAHGTATNLRATCKATGALGVSVKNEHGSMALYC